MNTTITDDEKELEELVAKDEAFLNEVNENVEKAKQDINVAMKDLRAGNKALVSKIDDAIKIHNKGVDEIVKTAFEVAKESLE